MLIDISCWLATLFINHYTYTLQLFITSCSPLGLCSQYTCKLLISNFGSVKVRRKVVVCRCVVVGRKFQLQFGSFRERLNSLGDQRLVVLRRKQS